MNPLVPRLRLLAAFALVITACGDASPSADPDVVADTGTDSTTITDDVTDPVDVPLEDAPADTAPAPQDVQSQDVTWPDTPQVVPADADEGDGLDGDAVEDTQVAQDADAAPSPGDTTEAQDAEGPDDVSSSLDASPEEQDVESQTVLPFLASYGAVETLAGTAYITGKAVNGWGLSYEGGPAVNAELSRPHMTQADGQGRLFIADKDAHAIRRVDLDGTIHTVAGIGEAGDGPDTPTVGTEVALYSPNGIWVRWDGTVYVLDMENEKIRRLGPDGILETFFETGPLGTGRGLWVADDEQLAWISAGTEIKRWTPETGIEVVATGFVSLGNIAVKSNGQVAIADRGGHPAWWVGANGALLPLAGNGTTTGGGEGFAGLDTGIPGLRGIWFPPDGGVLLCGHIASRLYWMDDAGILHLMLDGAPDGTHAGDGEHWSTPGLKISEPRAVSMDHQGNIILTEHDGGFIRRILRTGPLP